MEHLSLGAQEVGEVDVKPPEVVEEFEDASPEEMEEVSEKDMDIDIYREQGEVEEEKYQEYYGLRNTSLYSDISCCTG